MRELARATKLEVAQYYLLGHSYKEIEEGTGVSHGSISNIVHEIEQGNLTIPGIPFDQVNDLRQLSLDLREKSLEPSQALLGLVFSERLRTLGITPEYLDNWAEVIKQFTQPDFTPRDFLEAALRLHELEGSQGKPYETLAEEYARLREDVDRLKAEVDSLAKSKAELSKEVEPLQSQLELLTRSKNKFENEVEIQTRKLQELQSRVKEAEEEKARIDKDTKDLKRRRAKLSSEVDSREESLQKLNDLGLSNEDLLRLTSFIERTSNNEGLSSSQVKGRFFSALSLFEDVSGLEKRRKAEIQQIDELIKRQSTLSGEILELEKRKGILQGEIKDNISATSQKIKHIGEEAASQLQQQVNNIKAQLDSLFNDTLRVGEIVGEMQQMVKKGEDAEQSLANFLKEVKGRVENR